MSSSNTHPTKSSDATTRGYYVWDQERTLALISILGENGGMRYRQYRGSDGSGKKKKEVASNCADELRKRGIRVDDGPVHTKIKKLEASYIKARDFLSSTGEGINDDDEKLKIRHIKDKVIEHCTFYFEIDEFARDRARACPPYRADSARESVATEAEMLLLPSTDGETTLSLGASDEADEILADQDATINEGIVTPGRAAAATASTHSDMEFSEDERDSSNNVGNAIPAPISVPAMAIPRRTSSSIDPSRPAITTKRRRGGATLAESLLQLGEMKMELEREKMKHRAEMEKERLKQQTDLEKARMLLLQQEIAVRLQESQERSLMLRLELSKLEQRKRRRGSYQEEDEN